MQGPSCFMWKKERPRITLTTMSHGPHKSHPFIACALLIWTVEAQCDALWQRVEPSKSSTCVSQGQQMHLGSWKWHSEQKSPVVERGEERARECCLLSIDYLRAPINVAAQAQKEALPNRTTSPLIHYRLCDRHILMHALYSNTRHWRH